MGVFRRVRFPQSVTNGSHQLRKIISLFTVLLVYVFFVLRGKNIFLRRENLKENTCIPLLRMRYIALSSSCSADE